jgi:hypothetical protein
MARNDTSKLEGEIVFRYAYMRFWVGMSVIQPFACHLIVSHRADIIAVTCVRFLEAAGKVKWAWEVLPTTLAH